jgi:hypothetical protein
MQKPPAFSMCYTANGVWGIARAGTTLQPL